MDGFVTKFEEKKLWAKLPINAFESARLSFKCLILKYSIQFLCYWLTNIII
jgi:hypothetical protein